MIRVTAGEVEQGSSVVPPHRGSSIAPHMLAGIDRGKEAMREEPNGGRGKEGPREAEQAGELGAEDPAEWQRRGGH